MRKVSGITQYRCILVLIVFRFDTQWVDSDKVLTLHFEKGSKRSKARLTLSYLHIRPAATLIPLLTLSTPRWCCGKHGCDRGDIHDFK